MTHDYSDWSHENGRRVLSENLDCIGDTLEQLDLLLTGGRLQQSQSMLKGRALVKDSYERHGADRYKAHIGLVSAESTEREKTGEQNES